MTLPMLARNYQFYIRQQQFKKAYAELSVAVQKTQIDMGEGIRCFYLKNGLEGAQNIDCDYFKSELYKNLSISKVCEGNAFSGKCFPEDMRGGDVVYAEVQGGNDYEAALLQFQGWCALSREYLDSKTIYVSNSGCIFMPMLLQTLIDINGHKGPNKWGHDIFIFEYNKRNKYDSVFVLEPSRRCHPLDKGGYYSVTFFDYLYGQNTNY